MLDVPAVRSKPSLIVRCFFRPLAQLWLWAGGWTVVGEMPNLAKFIIVAAPHKTNWDLPNAIAGGLYYGIPVRWMGKDSLFKWPYPGGVMRWLGGIPVDRSKSNNAVAQMVEKFALARELIVVIPPQGTRGEVARWKSGFYYIANGAQIPLVLCYIDYRSRKMGVAQVFTPTGNYDADLAAIQAIYAGLAAPVPKAA